MKKIHKKMLVQLLFGFLIGRVVLLERNPAGAAFFAGALAQGGGVVPLLFSVGLGMLSALPVEAVLRYGVGMLGIVVAKNLMERQGMKWSIWQSSGNAGCPVCDSVYHFAISVEGYFIYDIGTGTGGGIGESFSGGTAVFVPLPERTADQSGTAA